MILVSVWKVMYSLNSLIDVIYYTILSLCYLPFWKYQLYKIEIEDMIFDIYYHRA
jgi:hypothetical protein